MSDAEIQAVETGGTPDLKPTAAIITGILAMIAGVLAMGAPFIGGTMVTMFIGAALLIGGIFELIGVFASPGWKAKLFGVLHGLLSIFCGGAILARPVLGLAVLTMILICFFLVDGILRIVLSLKMRPDAGWGLGLLGGIVTTLLAILIWRQWPWSGVWAIGTLVGIRMLFAGGFLLALGTQVKAINKTDTQAMPT